MKIIATIFFIFFIGTLAQAQDTANVVPVAIETVEDTKATILPINDATSTARLYRSKNARITKALNFVTKRNGAKIA